MYFARVVTTASPTWLAQLVGRKTAEREVGGSNPHRTTHQGLKITGWIMLAVLNTLSQFR